MPALAAAGFAARGVANGTGDVQGLFVLVQAPGGARSLSAPAQVSGNPGSEIAVPVSIGNPGQWPNGSFLRVSGLPRGATISEGFAIAPTLWAVPLILVRDLKLKVPADAAGNTVLQFAVATVEGQVVAEARTSVQIGGSRPEAVATALTVIAPAPQPARPPRTRAEPPAGPAVASPAQASADVKDLEPPPPDLPPAPESVPLSPEQQRALGFIARGQEQLADGNIAAARLLFQRAADAGLAYGALFLGESYDPHELALYKVRGIAGDVGLARSWYEKARSLGAPEAEARLQRLGR